MIARLLKFPLILVLAGLAALSMFLPALHAVMLDDHSVAQAFFYSGALGLTFVGITGLAMTGQQTEGATDIQHLGALFLAYTALPLFLALPFYEGLETTRYINAYFEMVSALTMLGLDEMMARYASYEDLAELIRHRFTDPKDTLRELYGRICFNILCGNTDDHARNHAAFWDGKALTLTPAYDICPQGRAGGEASQAMLIKGEARASTIATILAAAANFHLTEEDAASLIENHIANIAESWRAVCEEAKLSPVDQRLLAGRQFLNPYCIEGLGEEHAALAARFEDARAQIVG
jgi:hypothetical protein